MGHIIVTGAAGFIGSHLTDRFLLQGHRVTGVDNLTRGTRENLTNALSCTRFHLVEADISDESAARSFFRQAHATESVSDVWHMAANSDIPAGVADPRIDLRDTFMTTFQTLLMMRDCRIPRLAFASSSAVYGVHEQAIHENTGPALPISGYGAMKLGSEGLISAALETFLEKAWIFRFPNVIGSRATHGVIYDLLHKLRHSTSSLEVLGDGLQQKPYIHVSELIEAMEFIGQRSADRMNCYNISADDAGATVRFIAEAVVAAAAPGASISYTGGAKGWAGDVANYRYATDKLRSLGWRPGMSSEQAVQLAVREIHLETCRQ